MLRLSALLCCVLVAAGLVGLPTSAQAEADAVLSIRWTPCRNGDLAAYDLECGSLQVPLDHARPAGERITLALTRRLHTSATYKGVLLTNPGGPGGSGLSLPALSDSVPGGAGAAYDWIGFDPRGVGASTPSLHCSPHYFGYDRPSYVPTRRWITRYWQRKNQRYAASCADTPTERRLLGHLTTLDTVRDMDLVRAALGASTISYYGFSYGTYLGQVYATRYPTRVGRFVLDGVVNSSRVWYAANLDQDRAFDANMDVFWRYLAATPSFFRLGRSWKQIRRGYYRELRRLDRHPAAHGRFGPDELADVMLEAGYYVYDWVSLGQDYSDLLRAGRADYLLERYQQSSVGDDNGFAVYNAVQCTDVAWPGWRRTRRDARRVYRRSPFLTWGNTWYNGPCLSWHAPHHRPLVVSGRAVSSAMLLISETRDAATPYSGALATRSRFPSASLVAGAGGTTHASSLSGVACVDDTVADYLRTGRVPLRRPGSRADRSCPRLAPPLPAPAELGRRTVPNPDPMPPLLRRDLLAAQRSTLG